MKNKIYSSLLVIAVALIGFFVAPLQGYSHNDNGSSQYTWELSYCNHPNGSTAINCDAANGACLEQTCECEH